MQQRAGVVEAGGAVLRRARGRRGDKQIVAVGLQAGIVDESRQRKLPEDAGGRASRQRHRHLALGVDGQPARVRRDGDGGLHQIAFGGDDAALVIHLERAVARIAERAVGHQDLEPAGALNGDIERVAGLRQRALGHQPRRADGFDAGAELDADRQDVAVVGCLRADPLHVFVDQVLEFGALALEAGGRHIGEVAGDDLDLEVHGRHSGRCSVKRTHGLASSNGLASSKSAR